MLFGIDPGTPRIAEHIAFGDTDARFVRHEVITVEKLDRLRCYQRQIEITGKRHRGRNQIFLLSMQRGIPWLDTLNFEIEGIREQLHPMARTARRQIGMPLLQGFADIAQRRTRQGEQPVDTDLVQHLPGDFGAAAYTRREMRSREQFAELQIALMRAAEQKQAVGAILVVFVGEIDVAAENRLDALRPRRGVELDESETVGEVGQRQCRHTIRGSTQHGRTVVILACVKAYRTVGHGIFAVQAQVDKTRFGHLRHFTLPVSSFLRRLSAWFLPASCWAASHAFTHVLQCLRVRITLTKSADARLEFFGRFQTTAGDLEGKARETTSYSLSRTPKHFLGSLTAINLKLVIRQRRRRP